MRAKESQGEARGERGQRTTKRARRGERKEGLGTGFSDLASCFLVCLRIPVLLLPTREGKEISPSPLQMCERPRRNLLPNPSCSPLPCSFLSRLLLQRPHLSSYPPHALPLPPLTIVMSRLLNFVLKMSSQLYISDMQGC
eukprot:766689-Hanusia_phi.AAC.3